MSWVITEEQQLPKLQETLFPVWPDDILELDEAWSFMA
jgi:hypothetical protein